MKILIADDDALSRRLLEKTLERAGYEVTAVENGRQAVEHLVRHDTPRLALLDWMMPEVDGPGVCREVRARREHGYVYMVLLTSKESKEDIVTGLKSGADDYLTKPFDAEELKARLRTGQRILDLEDRLVEAREQMRFKATHDHLTTLWNRGVIMDLLNRELMRSSREQSSIALLLCDIDHFKSVNDTFGHVVGDEVLQEVAHRFLSSVRSYDCVGRYGGEEFLIVLINCEPRFATMRAEEIRKSMAAQPVQTSGGPVNVTISGGLLFNRDWGARPIEVLLSEVDTALYAAKAAGRNCIKLAQPGAQEGAVALVAPQFAKHSN
jgi:diguanylate cyclase (GGDEF)-like protein